MTFLWPEMLFLGMLVGVAVFAYLGLARRHDVIRDRYSGMLSTGDSGEAPRGLLRHLPGLLLLLSLVLLCLAAARPSAKLTLPARFHTVILAIDVSNSMRATDVEPNRFEAAKKAVAEFVTHKPDSTRIGLVAFASTAALAQAPTTNSSDILSAVNRLQLQNGTAIGSAILVGLRAIFSDVELNMGSEDMTPGPSQNDSTANDKFDLPPPKNPVAPGSNENAAIILLTDGQATTGADPVKAAQAAAERGIRVYTVGVGTPKGVVLNHAGWSAVVQLDEESLTRISRLTAAEYYNAQTSEDLTEVYKKVTSQLVVETRETEITALFAGIAALFALLGGALSMVSYHRLR